MPIPNANESYFPLNQKDMRLVWGMKRLLDAIPNKTLAANIKPKLLICPPMAKSNWKIVSASDRATIPILMPNLSRKNPMKRRVNMLGNE